jgi:hypothetical protein
MSNSLFKRQPSDSLFQNPNKLKYEESFTKEGLYVIEKQICKDMFFTITDMCFFIEITIIYKYLYPSIRYIRNNDYTYTRVSKLSEYYLWLTYIYICHAILLGYAVRRIEKAATAWFFNKNPLSENEFQGQISDMFPKKLTVDKVAKPTLSAEIRGSIAQ